jgi:hypothetical protein
MAKSLADIVGKNKGIIKGPGGVLTEETPDLQQLTGQAGLPAAPTTAVGGGLIGATPQQQKMIGTPAQTQAALRMSMEGAETLQEARRRGQVRTQATEAEQARMQKAKELEGLSAAEKKTQELIGRETDRLAAPEQAEVTADKMLLTAAPTGAKVTPEAYAGARPTMVKVLADIQAGKTPSQADIAAINKAFGRNATDLVDINFLNQFLVDSADAIKQQGAQAVRDNLTVQDLLNEPDFGYTSAQLSQLLGVDEPTLLKTTVGDLDNLINAVQAQDFSQVAQTQAAMRSGTLGQAEMEAARGTLREAESVGIASTEADFQKLEDAVSRADIVTFAGKQMTVGDALKDDNIEKFITDYVRGDETKRKEMEAQEPGLTTFIKNNLNVFTDATKGLETATGKFKTTQEASQKYAENFPPELLDAVLPGWKDVSDVPLQDRVKNTPIFGYFNTLNDTQKKQVTKNLQLAITSYPELAKELGGLNEDQLKRLNLDKSSTTLLNEYIAGRNRYKDIQNLDPDDIDSIVQQLAGNDADAAGLSGKKMQGLLDQNARLKYLGYKGADLSAFDSDNDGRLDSPDVLLKTLMEQSKVSSLGRFLRTRKGWSLPNVDTALPEGGQALATLSSKLSKEFKDNVLTEDEIVKNKNLTLEDIQSLIDTEEYKNLPVQVRTGLSRKAESLRAANFDNDMRGVFGDFYSTIYDDPTMQAQVADPEIYRRDINASEWGAVLANLDSKSNMLSALDAQIAYEQKQAFPKMDIGKMIAYRNVLAAMVQMTQDRKAQLEAEASAAEAAEQQRIANEIAQQEAQRREDERQKKNLGKRDVSTGGKPFPGQVADKVNELFG